MSNPKNKKNINDLIEKTKHLNIEFLDVYINTDTKITYKCEHGINTAYPWALKKQKYCCRHAYNLKAGPKSKTITERQHEILSIFCDVDVDNIQIDSKKIYGIRCTKHNEIYDQYISSMQKGLNGCAKCKTDLKKQNVKFLQRNTPFSSFMSRSETNWLNSLNKSIERQYWLDDIKYRVDGYESETNTVYLYHGRFWHGCPETYDPEELHPVIGIKMKDLYEKTLFYENKIKEAGYNLVVKWGQ